jgi:hypothetical protein
LKSPGFNPSAYKVKTRLQSLLSNESACTATAWAPSHDVGDYDIPPVPAAAVAPDTAGGADAGNKRVKSTQKKSPQKKGPQNPPPPPPLSSSSNSSGLATAGAVQAELG